MIAQVHGACIAGGLMLAWVCDLIVAADDAFFADPVVRMGIPGVEYFAHPWVMGPRQAKEFLFLGERISAARAHELGMINRVVPRERLAEEVTTMAGKIAAMPRLGLALTKKAVNQAEDAMGLQVGMDSVFGLHHLAHAHNAEVGADSLAGQDARSMRDARQRDGAARPADGRRPRRRGRRRHPRERDRRPHRPAADLTGAGAGRGGLPRGGAWLAGGQPGR